MNIFKKAAEKWKALKNKELALALVLAVVVLAITFFSVGNKSVEDSASFDEYIAAMENKLTSVIGKMVGNTHVKVAISYSAAEETVYAESTVTANGTVTSDVVKVNGKPLVVKTLPPQIRGVVVVVDGADAQVKAKIKQAVVTLLGISFDQVQVFTYKS